MNQVPTLLPTIVHKSVQSMLLALLVVSFWYLVVAATPAIHRAIFRFVPPDGSFTASERSTADAQITAFVRYLPPSDGDLPELSAKEQLHLDDVMMLNGMIWLYVLPGALIGLALSRFSLTEPLAITWAIGLIGLISVAMFDAIFVGIHPLLFPNGGWELPSDEFVLTQIYPLGFFVWAWAVILSLSIGTLLVLRLLLRSKQKTVNS